MTEASKKRPRDDIPCVPIGSPVWIVKSWRELARGSLGITTVSATRTTACTAFLQLSKLQTRRPGGPEIVMIITISREEGYEGQEEEEGTEEEEEEEGTDEEAKKVNDEEPFVYCRHLG